MVRSLWPKGGKVLLAAELQGRQVNPAGQRSGYRADGGQFLGRFDATSVTDGTIVVIDLGLSPDMMRRWLRDQGIVNQSKVRVIPMRDKAR